MTKLVFLAFLAMAVAFGEAATITVGGTTGWAVPPNTEFYDNWEDSQNIFVGDNLVFNYNQGQHDVARVTEAAYEACDISSPIFISQSAPFSFTINDTSDYYFICTIGTHCVRGQKLAVTDVQPSTTPTTSAPAPGTANAPSSSTTPPPPPPPPSNSAQSISSAFSVVVVAAIAVAFFA